MDMSTHTLMFAWALGSFTALLAFSLRDRRRER